MPSLAFLTGFVGTEILNSTTDGWILWAITVLSTFILGAFNRSFNKRRPVISQIPNHIGDGQSRKSLSKTVVDSISHASQAMLVICACVVFFSVLIRVLELALLKFEMPSEARRILLGSLEITYAISECREIKNELIKRVASAFFVGWSGLCVHFQVISLCERVSFSFKRYFILKFLQGIICALIALAVFKFRL
jgi:hypothetical protein